jgi:hypothetical protein
MIVMAPISVGELIDKITILEIKQLNARTDQQRANIDHELELLIEILNSLSLPAEVNDLRLKLRGINQALWYIEEYKRECEKADSFEAGFITAARQVYLKNDQRAAIKRSINELCGSNIVEEKIY